MSEPVLSKVTAFVTRPGPRGIELLCFEHPNAGIQLPAGTVEPGEELAEAARRELREETGLTQVTLRHTIGHSEQPLSDGQAVVLHATRVYARPDAASFDWAAFRRGIYVREVRRAGDWAQVCYEEGDRYPDPQYVTYSVLGWVPVTTLARKIRRYFFHLTLEAETPARWTQVADNHIFALFWAPLAQLPDIVAPQNEWLPYVRDVLGYRFEP